MWKEMLKNRNIPDVMTFFSGNKVTAQNWEDRRTELKEILSSEEYGYSPKAPAVIGEIVKSTNNAYANKAIEQQINIKFLTDKGEFSFPVFLIVPKDIKKPPLFLNIAFRPDVPDRYLPVEEIIDNGFAIATFCYKDVTNDANDESGLYGMYERDPKIGWGKISVWAWAASRVMDYLQTLDTIDINRIAITGHSRLGKTALWCGALDERFSLVISNCSGCSGAALNHGKKADNIESIARITTVFPYWFCGNYKQYADKEDVMTFDQHFLLALTAPRHLYINSAIEDIWAHPISEFLATAATNSVYQMFNKDGLIIDDIFPAIDKEYHKGSAGYHVRSGSHFYSRTDWLHQMAYRKLHNT